MSRVNSWSGGSFERAILCESSPSRRASTRSTARRPVTHLPPRRVVACMYAEGAGATNRMQQYITFSVGGHDGSHTRFPTERTGGIWCFGLDGTALQVTS